jgi:Tol biopolymer transport system component
VAAKHAEWDSIREQDADTLRADRERWPKKIYETNGQGGDRWLIVPKPVQQFNVLPVWSPDQSRIAYSGSWETTLGLYVLRDDGSNPTTLVSDSAAGDPAWKPTP